MIAYEVKSKQTDFVQKLYSTHLTGLNRVEMDNTFQTEGKYMASKHFRSLISAR